MHAITLHQPYASLIACGAKRIETRNWPAPPAAIGQPIAIHAGKSTDDLWLADEWPFFCYLDGFRTGVRAVPPMEREWSPIADQLPRGVVLCTAILDRCKPITVEGAAKLKRERPDGHPDEHAFGNYNLDDGPRFAWVLRDVESLPEPIPARGLQKVWQWDPEPADATQATLL